MVNLQSSHDYVVLFILAATFGALGGLAYELLLARGQEAGGVEWPGRRTAVPHFLDLGFLASMFLGAVAAVAVSYFFTPETQVKVTEGGKELIKTQWQIVKVVPLSLIVGSAGGAFLSAMQARVLAQLKEQEAEATKRTAQAITEQLATGTKQVATAAATAAAEKVGATAEQTVQQAAQQTTPALAQQLDDLAQGAPYEAEIRDLVGSGASVDTGEHLEHLQNAKDDAVAEAVKQATAAIDEQLKTASASLTKAATT
jgi:hypothetical protein